ncbi:putative bifunctional diguanylate cyclase/phosphodiesterase [Paenibacillus roseipurpureus]|uniref:Bifunctional diguanylate cyclase/phosphodiesterase n=1 Tax=Paenibacillus roseopurpureus TaxID=2918901 RepID=A0AA96RLL1_9BACL|nr:bifunctional diguanylate cyclase/phosphodiesterase [Paenibacillus sp. MBLB1832]WNR45531.1 bifunctional diguanylate cyclase/phosphodiesterase [Paenibacillus sp. MBLB1832]
MKAIWRQIRVSASSTIQALKSRSPIPHLPSREQLISRLTQAVHQLPNSTTSYAILLLDLDRFRQINFSLGYTGGDYLLQEVGRRLKQLDHLDYVARSGDDEYTLLLRTTTQDQFHAILLSIQHIFADSFTWQGQDCFLSASFGLSAPATTTGAMPEAFSQAEQALLQAKQTGRNKLVTYQPTSLKHRFANQIQMETDLRKAITHNQLLLYYQPRLELSTDRIICLEALVRWNHPQFGMIPPTDFISLAEESGLILPLGEWVLREACLQKARWLAEDKLDYQIAVNISPCQFQDEAFADKAIQIIEQTGINPAYLEFEITESSIMQNMEKTVAVLEKLCAKGISISIDDFGIGYSSLNYLKEFPIHCLKIDRSFVKNIQSNSNDWAITHAIIHLGHALNIQVVAEGVEEIGQLDILKETTCTTIQGFLLSPPISAQEIELTFHEKTYIEAIHG